MIYVKRLRLPGEYAELKFIEREKRTCFHTFHPFKIFPEKGLGSVEFDNITMFYGGNGSGKSTLLNILAEKIGAIRYSDFNDSPFFDKYLSMCYVDYARMPGKSFILTSDDVFDYALNARTVNGNIDEKRQALFDRYVEVKNEGADMSLHGLDDYDRWREVHDILSPKKSQSSFIRDRVVRDVDLHSNGETAMKYFLERIDEDALYLLDEPENSLSVERQTELAEYIEATARATRSQFVIATHSPILLSILGARVYNLDEYPAAVCKWTDLPNVRRYFDFFMSHKDEF